MRLILTVLSLFIAQAAVAQSVQECDWRARADAIAEPWSENTRTFANGDVRLALIDIGEPAVGGYHILILSPPYGDGGWRQCRVLTYQDIGFGGVEFDMLEAEYDPARGLVFYLPVSVAGQDGYQTDRELTFQLNQATGEILSLLSRY
ncbi:hypothetical protein [Pseudooceanicola sp. MF1-13]|uniref:hypothetical protein n=1 Tax=Pseudooceanicola sp. MF1-13 TaxID=3379095 RepID=UPI0038928C05